MRSLAHSRTGLECQSAVWEHTDENVPEKGREMESYLLRLFLFFFLMIPIKCQHSIRQSLAHQAYTCWFSGREVGGGFGISSARLGGTA